MAEVVKRLMESGERQRAREESWRQRYPNEPVLVVYDFETPGRFIDIWRGTELWITDGRFAYFGQSGNIASPILGTRSHDRTLASAPTHTCQFESDEHFVKVLKDLSRVEIDHFPGGATRGRWRVSGEVALRIFWILTTKRLFLIFIKRPGDGIRVEESFQYKSVPFNVGEQIVWSIGDLFRPGLLVSTSEKAIYARCSTKIQYLETYALGENTSATVVPSTGFSAVLNPYTLTIDKTDEKAKRIKVGVGENDMALAQKIAATINSCLNQSPRFVKAPASPPAASVPESCPECGAQLRLGVNFCEQCGAKTSGGMT